MKKIYMIPSISVISLGAQAVCQINGGSGLQRDENEFGGTGAKKHNFTDDYFDYTAWPKSKSPWDD